MRLLMGAALFAGMFGASAQSPMPTVTIQAQNVNAIEKTLTQLAGSIQPELQGMVAGAFASIPLVSLDRDRPVGLAIWAEIPGQPPQMALYLPVTSEDAFKKDLNEAPGMFNDMQPLVFLDSGYQILSPAESLDEGLVKSWTPANFGKGSMSSTQSFSSSNPSLVRLTAQLSETAMLRTQGMMGVNLARVGMAQAMASDQAQVNEMGIDPKGMLEILEFYFKAAEYLIRGIGDIQVDIGMIEGSLIVEEQVHALEGTKLSKWIAGGDWTGGLKPLLSVAGPDDFVRIAIAIGQSEEFVSAYAELIEASMKLQGVDKIGDLKSGFTETGLKLLPLRTGGAISLAEGGDSLEWLFAYNFPDRSLDDVYPVFSEFIEVFKASGMVGADKMYSSMEWTSSVDKYSGYAIDRMTMSLNPESPLLQMPGQKEMLRFMYGGDTVTQDYAKFDKMLVGGTPAKLQQFLKERKDGDSDSTALSVSGIEPDEHTCFYLSANVGQIIAEFMKVVVISQDQDARDALKPIIAMLSQSNDRLDLKINLNNGMRSVTRLPVKTIATTILTGYTSMQRSGSQQSGPSGVEELR